MKSSYTHLKKGMTIVEMMIAISIFSIGIAGFTTLFVKSWQANSFILEEGTATRAGSAAIQSITNDLRKIRYDVTNTRPPIVSGDSTNFTVYLDDDNDSIPERVHYYLDDSKLKKGISQPVNGVYPNVDEAVIIMADYVMNLESQPVFKYYGNNDFVNPMDVSSLDFPNVKLVRVHLWINIKPLTAPDNVNFETFVDLRNLNEYL